MEEYCLRVVIAYCNKDEGQAANLADWMASIGLYPNHSILVARDKSSSVRPFADIGFAKYDEIEIRNDAWRKWPESCNNVFGECARYIEALLGNTCFLWLEPDVVPLPMKDNNWLNAIEKEYAGCNRPFLGDFVSVHTPELDVPNHMSGVGVYPASLIEHAGKALNAHTHAWDVAACNQIVPKMAVSKLILHRWKHEPFERLEDIQTKIYAHKPQCALFHADKSGSLITLLRQQKAGVVAISSPAAPSSLPAGAAASVMPETQTGSSVLTTFSISNNLPAVPVLAEKRESCPIPVGPQQARESIDADRTATKDSRGDGQLICDILLEFKEGVLVRV